MSSEYEQFINEWTEHFGSHPIQYNEKNNSTSVKRKDYCYNCQTDELYPHAMTLKCKICHKIVLG